MGWFSPKTTIQVASTVYNMAGNTEPRPNFLKTILFSALVSPYDVFIGETLMSNYISGPGLKQRSFQNWCISQSYPGLPSLTIKNEFDVNASAVEGEITPPISPVGLVTRITQAFITSGDFTYFADRYVYLTYPNLVGTAYLSEYYPSTNEILIQYVGGGTEIISAGIYDVNSDFLVAFHYFYLPSYTAAPIVGTLHTGITDITVLPNVISYTIDSTVNTGIVIYTFSDLTTEGFNGLLTTYSKTEYLGGDGITIAVVNRTTIIKIWEYRYVVTGDHLEPKYNYQITTQDVTTNLQIGDPEVFIYKIGSGNTTLDALSSITTGSPDPEFFPIIPIRLNNVSINDTSFSDTGNGLFKLANNAYKRMSGNQPFKTLVKTIEDNPSIGDIDYAYIQYGVAFNATDLVAKQYMYEFFHEMIIHQTTNETYMNDFITRVATYSSILAAYDAWIAAQLNPLDPLFGTTRPTYPSLVPPTMTTIQLNCTDARFASSDMRVSWLCITEDIYSGLVSGKKSGDLWFEQPSSLTYTIDGVLNTVEKTYLWYQKSSTSYRRLTMYGLMHQNFIYGGKFVQITAHEALTDLKESGFLVPLYSPTVKAMGMVNMTQLALSNTYLVFNSYMIHKTYWYQTFLGQLLLILLFVVISVVLSPAAFAGVSGALGTNLAVGVGLGLAGTAAIVAGAVANTLAAILISSVISAGSVAVFGEKWGALIGSILSFAFSFGLVGDFTNLSTFFNPGTLLKFGNALATGFQGFATAEIKDIAKATEDAHTAFLAREKEIADKQTEFGNDLSFDPISFTGIKTGNDLGIGLYRPENLDSFIQRTLMTGTDMVDLSIGFIENFTKISLTLPEN